MSELSPLPITADHQRVIDALGDIDWVLPGSVVERMTRCGKSACRCAGDPPQLHGPYIQWSRRIDGKTVTRMLTVEQRRRYQAWFDNARRIRELIGQLETVSLNTIEHAEGWKPHPKPARPA